MIAGKGRNSKSDAWKRRQRSSRLFGSSSSAAKPRDYKLVQTVAVMSSDRRVEVVVQDTRRDEQTKVLRR